jgi:hypothetical protein
MWVVGMRLPHVSELIRRLPSSLEALGFCYSLLFSVCLFSNHP